ncbi:MAG: hypothetical protein ABI551_20905, partial [Polyangiaceae bacterium]
AVKAIGELVKKSSRTIERGKPAAGHDMFKRLARVIVSEKQPTGLARFLGVALDEDNEEPKK